MYDLSCFSRRIMENLPGLFWLYPPPWTGDVFMAQRGKCTLQWAAVYLSYCGNSYIFSVICKPVPSIYQFTNVHICSLFFNSADNVHNSLYIPLYTLLSVPSTRSITHTILSIYHYIALFSVPSTRSITHTIHSIYHYIALLSVPSTRSITHTIHSIYHYWAHEIAPAIGIAQDINIMGSHR